jgi:short-subunit dehydrogenase
MKKNILILGGSSSIAKELTKLHVSDIVYSSYHTKKIESDFSFFLDLYEQHTYRNVPEIEYDIIYSFLGYTPAIGLIDDLDVSKETIERNFLYPALLIQHLLATKKLKSSGRMKIITSVAGLRGRKLNFVYGASKSAMQTFIEGLANRYKEFYFTDIILGPVYTDAVLVHNTPKFLISKPMDVALQIFNSKRQKVFVPRKWILIMKIIKMIPVKVFNQLDI